MRAPLKRVGQEGLSSVQPAMESDSHTQQAVMFIQGQHILLKLFEKIIKKKIDIYSDQFLRYFIQTLFVIIFVWFLAGRFI